MNSESGNRKDANASVRQVCGAVELTGVKGKAEARMYVLCRGFKMHVEEREKGDVCTYDWVLADGFRTHTTRVIRWRVLGVRATKVET